MNARGTEVAAGQSDVIEFLASPSTHGNVPVERIDTHASIVFLAGARAWKLKRAVRYDYLDFSTPDRRRAMCEAEVRLNRRTAPSLYLGVVPVTRTPNGALSLGGPGEPVDWVIEMVRFDQAALLDRIASRGALDLAPMRVLANAIARFHRDAEPRRDHGGRAGLAWVIDGNASGFAEQGAGILDPEACLRLTAASRSVLERHGSLLDARRDDGMVRQCHGDLHLRNIVMLDGRPTLFDAVEFNDEISCVDVLYDLAFLLMDLWRRDLPRHANVIWNGWLHAMSDFDGVTLLPLFLSCRASIRAKTSATAATLQTAAGRRAELESLARGYLSMAEDMLHSRRASLIAIGGFSGSGKSTVALELAPSVGPVPGAVVIRSDEIRKELFGIDPLARLGAEAYAPEVSRRVYAIAAERATVVLRAGHAAILDAVFGREGDRDGAERVAATLGVPFVGLWLEAPESVLASRLAQRRLDASDADAAVLHAQLQEDAGAVRWTRVDASRSLQDVLDDAKRHLA